MSRLLKILYVNIFLLLLFLNYRAVAITVFCPDPAGSISAAEVKDDHHASAFALRNSIASLITLRQQHNTLSGKENPDNIATDSREAYLSGYGTYTSCLFENPSPLIKQESLLYIVHCRLII
jgi:hypothetical protein